jgi:hypothetical protein
MMPAGPRDGPVVLRTAWSVLASLTLNVGIALELAVSEGVMSCTDHSKADGGKKPLCIQVTPPQSYSNDSFEGLGCLRSSARCGQYLKLAPQPQYLRTALLINRLTRFPDLVNRGVRHGVRHSENWKPCFWRRQCQSTVCDTKLGQVLCDHCEPKQVLC